MLSRQRWRVGERHDIIVALDAETLSNYPKRGSTMKRKQDQARASTTGAKTAKVVNAANTEDINLKIQPFGPTPDQLTALAPRLNAHPAVKKLLDKTRHRLLGIALVHPVEDTKPAKPRPPQQFRATFFDYTNNRSIIATGSLRTPEKLEVTESGLQPLPNQEEFDEAAALAMAHEELARAVREDSLRPYRPMPPLIIEELPDGTVERTVAVDLRPREGMRGHEIVGVNIVRKTVLRFEQSEGGRAPRTSAAHNPICGQPDANQAVATSTAGSVWVTVTQGGTTLWRFLVVRPAASSGTNGSGVELRYVDYRGKRLLYRAHVPILNVKYDGTIRPPSASPPCRAPACATCIIITRTGDSISTSARRATTSFANSTIRFSSAPRIGTTRISRSAGRATRRGSANGGSRTSRPARHATSFPARATAWPPRNPMRRSLAAMCGSFAITDPRSMTAWLRLVRRTRRGSMRGSTVRRSMGRTSSCGTARTSRTTLRANRLGTSGTSSGRI
jgi:hypothetical protein